MSGNTVSHVARVYALIVFLALAGAQAQAGDSANGARLFSAVGCSACHGTTGGGGIAGPPLAPKPLECSIVKAKLRSQSGKMPVYSEAVLSETAVNEICLYLLSIPLGKTAQEIPLLQN